MEELYLESFFEIKHFKHPFLFKEATYAWEPLLFLADFLQKTTLGSIETEIPPSAHLIRPELISIGKGTIVEPGAYICGPCVIGQNCEVRQGAYIRGFVVTGDDCVIGHGSEVKQSIFLDGACAAHFNYVGDSILGNEVNLGAGVKLANLRLDHEMISVHFKESKVVTKLKKLGAIIGDGAQVGCNGVTNPGCLIGKGAFCFPCMNISGYVPPFSSVKSNQKVMIQDYVDRNHLK